jgi:hypothetical protein
MLAQVDRLELETAYDGMVIELPGQASNIVDRLQRPPDRARSARG